MKYIYVNVYENVTTYLFIQELQICCLGILTMFSKLFCIFTKWNQLPVTYIEIIGLFPLSFSICSPASNVMTPTHLFNNHGCDVLSLLGLFVQLCSQFQSVQQNLKSLLIKSTIIQSQGLFTHKRNILTYTQTKE